MSIQWHYCKNGELPQVETPTDDNIFVHNMEICLVSYHFRLPDELDRLVPEQEKRERGIFIYQALREGINVWRYNTRFFEPILESIIVDAWISLDEVYDYLWQEEQK